MKEESTASPVLLPGQAAKLLGCGPGYVRYLVDAGRLPAQRGPGNMRLIPLAAVEALRRERVKARKGRREHGTAAR